MRGTTIKLAALLAGAVLAGLTAWADDKKDDNKGKPALSGVWMQTGGEAMIEFSKKDVMKISPHGDHKAIAIVCHFQIEKGGRVKVKVTEFEGDEDLKTKMKEFVPLGLEFSFKWQVKDDSATLDDLKGDKVEHLKSHLQGKFDRKK